LEKTARERGPIRTLGEVVHNHEVLQRLAGIGITVADNIDEMDSKVVSIGTHGISPRVEQKIRSRYTEVIDTTCPFVKRAQAAANRLAKADFLVVIYGDASHPEVRGILGWAEGQGIATMDEKFITTLERLPRRLGILSQTTQIPAHFSEFVKKVIDLALVKDVEIRIIDTICHDIRERQQAAFTLARKVDLMLVIGSHTSANTNHLAELCVTVAKTHLVETAADIQLSWLQNEQHIGVASGASTAEETINEVIARLEELG
jgi:4-hydroxy-3-methylbut-2-enyl diphosphate reductase